MEKKELKQIKEQVAKDYYKRFKQLFEYNFYAGGDTMDEAGEEDKAPPPDQGAPPADQSAPAVDVSPQSQLPQNEVPQQTPGQEAPPAGGEAPMDQPPMDGEQPMDGSEFEDVNVEEDDNVIDITDLTDAQEQTNSDVAQLDSKFDQFNQFAEKLTQALEKIVQRAEENENEIQSVKDEIIKRAPTPNEKLNIRTLDSSPYNQKISDYWEKVAATNPNYSITADNGGNKKEDEEYVLYDTDGEASDFEVYNSFNNNLRNLVGI
jgi:hypothetical protein